MAEVNRGEIWQFSFPAPDHRRPVLVPTRQEVIGKTVTTGIMRLNPSWLTMMTGRVSRYFEPRVGSRLAK